MKLSFSIPTREKSRKSRSALAPPPIFQWPSTPPLASIPLPLDLRNRLLFVRRRHRTVSVGTGVFMLLAAASLLFLMQGLADEWFDLPWAVRAVFLLVDLFLLASLYRRHLHPFVGRKMTLGKVALLVEKKWPRLRQAVITAVELAEGNPGATRGSRQLLDHLLQQARSQTATLNFAEVVPLQPLRRWAILGGLAILAVTALGAVTWPSSRILAERIFLLNVPLPTKTVVVAISGDMIVPLGSDVDLAARASGVIPNHGRVTLTYAGEPPQDFALSPLPDKPGVFSLTLHNVQKAFRYTFYLNDGHGSEFSVTARVPPSLSSLACREIYPDYTKLPPQVLPPTALSLLAGSHLQIQATASIPLQSATVVLKGLPQTIKATLDTTKTHLQAEIPIPAEKLTGFSLHLVDDAGLGSANEAVYAIDILPDKPPVIKIEQPVEASESITLHAKPLIAFEASDDYGLTRISLDYQLVPPPDNGEATTPEIERIMIPLKKNPQDTHYEYVFDVAAAGPALREGWSIDYWIEAADNNTATGPGITSTDHKQFTILSVEAKQAEILSRLKQDASDINTLSDTQQKASSDLRESIPAK
jgi:hypothetical protein